MAHVLNEGGRGERRPPLYCINQAACTKRAEIDVKSFAKTMESQPLAVIPFDFPKLSRPRPNNGRMIADVSKCHAPRAVPEHGERLAGPRRG